MSCFRSHQSYPDLVFPLAVTGQLVVNLSFAFEAQTHVGLVAVCTVVIRKIVQAIHFTVQIYIPN